MTYFNETRVVFLLSVPKASAMIKEIQVMHPRRSGTSSDVTGGALSCSHFNVPLYSFLPGDRIIIYVIEI